jgi:cytosine/creatinine deaminase
MSGTLELRGVALPATEGAWTVTIEDGVVAHLVAEKHAPSRLLLPAFADLHVHADRAFVQGPHAPRSLEDAIEMTEAIRAAATPDLMRGRAEQLISAGLRHGSTRIRSHADVDHVVEERAVAAVVAAGHAFAGRVDVEVVAFASATTDPATDEGRRLLRTALAAGATHIGAVPAFYGDPPASIEALLDLAVDSGLPVDVHLDETLDDATFNLSALAAATIARGLEGHVTAGHCCSLAAIPPADAARAIELVAAAQITIIALPALNLYLQDRAESRRRGVTLVRDLVAAGVDVRLASDNVGDVFFPYGDADLLEAAYLGAISAHVDDSDILLGAITDGRTRIDEGDRADLVLVNAPSFQAAVAQRPGGRVVFRGGVVVSGPQPV